MSDEERIRSLLTLAADLPDEVQAPVGGLIERGRRRRRLRAVGSVAGAAVIAAAAFMVPAAVRSPGTGTGTVRTPSGVVSGLPSVKPTGPTAAQLAGFRWSRLPFSPLGPRPHPLLTWTGRYLIELGGTRKGSPVTDGAVYDSVTRRWHLMAPPGNEVRLANAIAVWTGHQLFVTNGVASYPAWTGAPAWPAGLYDPATNRWTVTDMPAQLLGGSSLTATWTGRDIVVAAVVPHAGLKVAAYDPATRHWQMITPALPASHPPIVAELAAAPGRLLLWSLWSKSIKISKNGYTVHSGVDVLSLGRDGWATVTGDWPQHQTVDSPVYAGGAIFLPPSQIWCGLCSHPFLEYRSRLVSPANLSISQIPGGPLASHHAVQADMWVWTGRAAIAANTTSGARISQLAAYDPATKSWHVLPTPPRDPIATTPVWANRQLLLLTSTGNLWTLHR